MPSPPTPPSVITIVSGLPRSGTSVMMQMLDAGGLPALTDGQRAADTDNPRGYYEFEAVKRTKKDPSWLAGAGEKVVKLVHLLLLDLPLDGSVHYRIVMMRREIDEVLASQAKMLSRLGRGGASLPAEQLKTVFAQQMTRVRAHLAAHPERFEVLEVSYNDLVTDPSRTAAQLNQFLGGTLDEQKMIAAVDPGLYRNRKG